MLKTKRRPLLPASWIFHCLFLALISSFPPSGSSSLDIRAHPLHPRVGDHVTLTCTWSSPLIPRRDPTVVKPTLSLMWLYKRGFPVFGSRRIGTGAQHSMANIQLHEEGVYICAGINGEKEVSQISYNLVLNTEGNGSKEVLRHELRGDVSTHPMTSNLNSPLLSHIKRRAINYKNMYVSLSTTIYPKEPFSITPPPNIDSYTRYDSPETSGNLENLREVSILSGNQTGDQETTPAGGDHSDKALYLGIGFASVGTLAILAMIIVLIKCDSSKIYICDACNKNLPAIGCLKPQPKKRRSIRYNTRQVSIDPSTVSEPQPVEFYLETRSRHGSNATEAALLYYRRQSSDVTSVTSPTTADVTCRKQGKGPMLSLLDVKECEEIV
ncbi:uncharacterized protein LOC106150537 [Lingula anatina]|uniref:Uncharacterized protein LOC106150537 n=1 Tax=Lingula anatina TaxID=7574 RepID=A0A1S3GYB0_LINAN|nr:uncharacterized protein LOC106150537 [Lingula anatina]|eukprot:XP_013378860.1 uncharacterized protein LOC106150537 [Lingula anatina]